MWFWNRREVYNGNSMKVFSEMRDIAAANKIRYDYKVVDRFGLDRARFGSFRMKPDNDKWYYLYIHKNDYENYQYYSHGGRD